MDLGIDLYIQENYHPDLTAAMVRAFELFGKYDYDDYLDDLQNKLMNVENKHPEETRDGFVDTIQFHQHQICEVQGIQLASNTRIDQANEILEALLLVQDLDDFTPILVIMESDQPALDKFIDIIADHSLLTDNELFELVTSVEEDTVKRLYDHASKLQNNKVIVTPYTAEERTLLAKYVKFKEFVQNRDCLGFRLLSNNIVINQPFEVYIPLLKEQTDEDNENQAALDILSILYFSQDGSVHPLPTYRKYSNQIILRLPTLMRVDNLINQGVAQFERHLEALKNAKGHSA